MFPRILGSWGFLGSRFPTNSKVCCSYGVAVLIVGDAWGHTVNFSKTRLKESLSACSFAYGGYGSFLVVVSFQYHGVLWVVYSGNHRGWCVRPDRPFLENMGEGEFMSMLLSIWEFWKFLVRRVFINRGVYSGYCIAVLTVGVEHTWVKESSSACSSALGSSADFLWSVFLVTAECTADIVFLCSQWVMCEARWSIFWKHEWRRVHKHVPLH